MFDPTFICSTLCVGALCRALLCLMCLQSGPVLTSVLPSADMITNYPAHFTRMI